MSVDEQDKLAKEAVGMETEANDASKAHKVGFPAVGKVVCVLQERLDELKSDRHPDGSPKKRQIASNTTLQTYWESVTKTKGKGGKLNPHWYSCAVAFGTYVRSELITEKDYDDNTAQCLELAASISNAVGCDITHDAIEQAAEELRVRSKNSKRNLEEILATVKEPKAMTVEQAQKALAKILANGFLNLVIAGVGAEIAHVKDTEEARSAFFGIQTANDMFLANTVETTGDDKIKVVTRRFSDETLTAWFDAYDTAKAPKPATPVPAVSAPAAPETEEVPEAQAA
jgi:hypothetical protein